MKKVTRMFLAVVFVLSFAGGASARNAGLSESEISLFSWQCFACNGKILTLTDFGRYLTNRKDKGASVLDELEKYLKDQRSRVKNFFTNTQIPSCSKGSAEYNNAHNFDLIEVKKFKPDEIVLMKDKLFYVDM